MIYSVFNQIPLLAQIFGLARLSFMNNTLFPLLARIFGLLTLNSLLARSFFRIQGLGRIQNGAVLLYCEYLNVGRKRSSQPKETTKNKRTANMKANPNQTHPNPFFQRSIFDYRSKTRIFDKFRQTFLCKANPFYKLKIKDLQLYQKLSDEVYPAPKWLVLW